jgi:eukaryotic-like serine/threonine-protein kinase
VNIKYNNMFLKFGKTIAGTLLFSVLFFSCSKPTQSSDAPFTPSYNPSVIVGSDNHVIYALNPLTAIKNWEYGFSGPIFASPMLYNEMLYVACSTGDTLFKLDAHTGTLIKKITTGAGPFAIKATPTADANLIYLACMNNTIYAIDTGTYLVKWQYTAGGAIESSPVVFNGYVFFGCDDGKIYALDKTLGGSGVSNWTFDPVAAGLLASPTRFVSSPCIGYTTSGYPATIDTVLCVGAGIGDSSMYCLKLKNNCVVDSFMWQYKAHGGCNSSPTIRNGACIFGSEDFHVYCVDILSGAARWVVATGSNVFSSPFVYGQSVYVGSNDYNLYSINIINGVVKWKFKSFGAVRSSPLGYGQYVYVGSEDKNFYALDTASGSIKWTYNVNQLIQCSPVVDNLTGKSYNSGISGMTN